MPSLYATMRERPENFDLNIDSPLYRGLVFAGLGSVSKGYRYTDSSLYGNHGTLTGYTGAGNTPPERWSRALGRNVLGFNGSTDYVLSTTLGSFGSSQAVGGGLTYMAWVKYTATTGRLPFFCQSSLWNHGVYFAANTDELFASSGATNKIAFFRILANSTAGPLFATTSAISSLNNGGWHHIAATLGYIPSGQDVTKCAIYVDGVLQGISVSAQSNDWSNYVASNYTYPMTLGARPGSVFFSGSMADPMIFSGVLPPWKIAPIADPSNVDLRVGGVPLILPPRRRVFAAAVAGGFQAYWARRQQQIIGAI